jgi:hypothetical protein|nr:MAG TPA: hypothetical protein [Caudoviricetes sp.]
MDSQNNSLSFLDMLTVFSVMLQTVGYEQDQRQTSNDVLLKELQKQNILYLDEIIENQHKILEKLSKINE